MKVENIYKTTLTFNDKLIYSIFINLQIYRLTSITKSKVKIIIYIYFLII